MYMARSRLELGKSDSTTTPERVGRALKMEFLSQAELSPLHLFDRNDSLTERRAASEVDETGHAGNCSHD